ncbi:MAG: ABC transporter substrate-binding protein, partial [Thermomicrobiales bacterium]
MSRMLKRGPGRGQLRIVVLAMLLAWSSVGIGLGFDRVSAQDSSVISFAFWGDPAEEAAYQLVIDQFEEVHPNIDVRATYTPDQGDYYTKTATSFAGGDPPDIFLINFREYAQFVARGALEPIGDLLVERGTELDDYYEPPRESFTL